MYNHLHCCAEGLALQCLSFFLQDNQLGVFQNRPIAVTVVLRRTPILYKSSHCMVLMPGQRWWKPAKQHILQVGLLLQQVEHRCQWTTTHRGVLQWLSRRACCSGLFNRRHPTSYGMYCPAVTHSDSWQQLIWKLAKWLLSYQNYSIEVPVITILLLTSSFYAKGQLKWM